LRQSTALKAEKQRGASWAAALLAAAGKWFDSPDRLIQVFAFFDEFLQNLVIVHTTTKLCGN
jgi:hypothetical protein